MHFRSFAPFLAFVFATSVFAAPVPTSDALVARVDTGAVSVPAKIVTEAETVASGVAPRALPSLQQILQNASTKMTPFINDLEANVADKAAVDAQLVTSNLNNIITVLTSLQTELEGLATNPTSLVESLLSIGGILTTLGPLIQLLFTVLVTVMSAVAASPLAPVVTPLIATIGALVGNILNLVLQIAPGILTGPIPTLSSLVPALGVLGLNSILSIMPL